MSLPTAFSVDSVQARVSVFALSHSETPVQIGLLVRRMKHEIAAKFPEGLSYTSESELSLLSVAAPAGRYSVPNF